MRRTWLAMLMVGGLGLARPALAQPLPQRRAQVRQQITDYMLQQLTQELALDPATAQRVREVWQRYQQQIAGVHRDMGATMKELRALLATPQPDPGRSLQLADRIVRDRQQVQQLEIQRTGELRGVLSPVQFARGVTLAPRLQRQVRRQMLRAMRGGGAAAPAAGDDVE